MLQKSISKLTTKLRFQIWASMSTPDLCTAQRHWVLCIRGQYFCLPIQYTPKSKQWMRIEKLLEARFYRFFEVSY